MKYSCKICGYLYDDDVQPIPFSALPDTWTCPLCGAPKSDFEPLEETEAAPKPAVLAPVLDSVDEDMKKLSVAEFSALCSNLARGCEKQYQNEASALFRQLADYFSAITLKADAPKLETLAAELEKNLNEDYPRIYEIAGNAQDRGALRVMVWGEKVSRILKSLLERYQKEGEAFLADTEIWVCSVCGFVYVGPSAPELCPVCKVPAWKFDRIERQARV